MTQDSISIKQKLLDWKLSIDDEPLTNTDNWLPAEVPSTILNAMVENGVVPDPRESDNYFNLPGVPDKETLDHFALREMPEGSLFSTPKWWRTSFYPPDSLHGENKYNCILELNGINYRANIWLNGYKVADSSDIVGTYRKFEIDLSKWVVDAENILELEIFPPGSKDLAFSFVDWHPMPPDKCSGLWRDVNLIWSKGLRILDVYVSSKLNMDYSRADVSIEVEIENLCKLPRVISYHITSEYFEISGEETVPQKGKKTLLLTSGLYPELIIDSPPLWWPYQFGEQNLVNITVSIEYGGIKQDYKTIEHGFREITSYLNHNGDRQIVVNGHNFLIRGAAWAPDMLMKDSEGRDKITIAYLKNMGLNSLRFEGNFGSDNLWRLCDQEGVLILAGWVCDSFWEEYQYWEKDTYAIAGKSLSSLLRRFRNHASFATWLNGSDLLAPPDVEKMYLSILDKEAPALVSVASAGMYESEVSGRTGFKMSGPYSYVPPVYWYLDEMPGFAKGFNTETGPDVSIPPFESLARMLGPDHMQVGSSEWCLHSGLRQFRGTEIVETAITERYGPSLSMEMFTIKAQVLSYETWRAMFEACARNRGDCTGIIGWMLTNSWPSLIWHLYDSYNYPTGGFFGAKKACSPIHAMLDYKDNSLWASNSTLHDYTDYTFDAELTALNKEGGLDKIWSDSYCLDIKGNESLCFGHLRQLAETYSVYFLFTFLSNGDHLLDRNCYWLSSRQDILSNEHIQFGTTKVLQHGDFSALDKLPFITLEIVGEVDPFGRYSFTMKNCSTTVAFFVETILRTMDGIRVLPVLWTDNFVTIRPDETITISGELLFPVETGPQLKGEIVKGEIAGYNVKKTQIIFKRNEG